MTKIDHIDDCLRIQDSLLRHGIEATLAECQYWWRERSAYDDAMWMILPNDPREIYWQLDDFTDFYSKIECP